VIRRLCSQVRGRAAAHRVLQQADEHLRVNGQYIRVVSGYLGVAPTVAALDTWGRRAWLAASVQLPPVGGD
jgi:hypothetical protein